MSEPNAAVPARRAPRAAAAARERLAAVGFIASLIGHKARNRLALVRAGLELLALGAEEALTTEHRTELLAQLDRFLGDFNLGIEMIRCDFGYPETGLLGGMVADAVETFRPHAEAAGVELVCALAETDERVDLDRRLLRLVLINLLRNAQEAGAKTIRVSTAFTARGFSVEVHDDGPGVSREIAARLFREAVSTRSDGTGLGLLLCRDALAAMDGRIRLARTAKGARFVLAFPRR